MARTKDTIRRLRQPTFVAPPGQRIGNKNILNRRQSRFKIKKLLPQTLQVEVKKNGHIARKMNVRRKLLYSFVTED